MALLCERCKQEVYKYELCNYCGRRICDACMKSSLNPKKVVRLVICKDCWSDMKKRRAFKNKRSGVEIDAPQERAQ